jgi:glycerate 2-kinase
MQADRFLTRSLQDQRIARLLSAAVQAADAGRLVANHFWEHPIPPHKHPYLLGIGKAAEGMTRAAADALGAVSAALVVTKRASSATLVIAQEDTPAAARRDPVAFRVLEAGHPIPDARSLAAGDDVLRYVGGLESDDLLICLISGGASALVAAPLAEVSLADLQSLTDELLRSGASINEINVLRRQVDALKGGGLAAATRASVLSLILSDVIGDELEAIASGPTAADRATPEMATGILRKYGIRPGQSIEKALLAARARKTGSSLERVVNVIIGNNRRALEGAREQAALEGFHAEILAGDIRGEASEAGRRFASTLTMATQSRPRPFCLIAGGETTVSLGTGGKGGRNQELALAAVDDLDGLANVALISLATDGEDGPTDAAGAVVTGETCVRAIEKGMPAADFLARHDSYAFFDPLGDLLRPGYTGTNVNDVMLLVGL